MFHYSDCCESVDIAQLDGDAEDLIGVPLSLADVVEDADKPESYTYDYTPESCTWIFYRFATVKGYVNIRWLGRSNGYYSERVSLSLNGRRLSTWGGWNGR